MIAFSKLVYTHNPKLTGFDYLMCRSLPMVILTGSNVLYQKVDLRDVKPGYRILLLGRCLIGTLNMLSLFSSLQYIP